MYLGNRCLLFWDSLSANCYPKSCCNVRVFWVIRIQLWVFHFHVPSRYFSHPSHFMKLSFTLLLKPLCKRQCAAPMSSCQGRSSPSEVCVLWLLFGSIKGLFCSWSLEPMGCESHHPARRLSAKGKSKIYLPSQFLSQC